MNDYRFIRLALYLVIPSIFFMVAVFFSNRSKSIALFSMVIGYLSMFFISVLGRGI